MAGYGTGYPVYFICAKLARRWPRSEVDYRMHEVTVTGRTRPTPRNGKGHPRKSWTTREYRCSCGHVGWSSHVDLERRGQGASRG